MEDANTSWLLPPREDRWKDDLGLTDSFQLVAAASIKVGMFGLSLANPFTLRSVFFGTLLAGGYVATAALQAGVHARVERAMLENEGQPPAEGSPAKRWWGHMKRYLARPF